MKFPLANKKVYIVFLQKNTVKIIQLTQLRIVEFL